MPFFYTYIYEGHLDDTNNNFVYMIQQIFYGEDLSHMEKKERNFSGSLRVCLAQVAEKLADS